MISIGFTNCCGMITIASHLLRLLFLSVLVTLRNVNRQSRRPPLIPPTHTHTNDQNKQRNKKKKNSAMINRRIAITDRCILYWISINPQSQEDNKRSFRGRNLKPMRCHLSLSVHARHEINRRSDRAIGR